MRFLITILLVLFTIGCKTTNPVPPMSNGIYEENILTNGEGFGQFPYMVITADSGEIQARWADRLVMEGLVGGFINHNTKEIWVPWDGTYDINGEPLPSFYVLGHEVWHIVKGKFHKPNKSKYE